MKNTFCMLLEERQSLHLNVSSCHLLHSKNSGKRGNIKESDLDLAQILDIFLLCIYYYYYYIVHM